MIGKLLLFPSKNGKIARINAKTAVKLVVKPGSGGQNCGWKDMRSDRLILQPCVEQRAHKPNSALKKNTEECVKVNEKVVVKYVWMKYVWIM